MTKNKEDWYMWKNIDWMLAAVTAILTVAIMHSVNYIGYIFWTGTL